MAIRTIGGTRPRASIYVVAGALALVLSGCAGGAEGPEPTEPGATTPTDSSTQDASGDGAATEGETADAVAEEAGDDGAGAEAGGQLGTITIDTTTYDVLESVNCTPVSPTDLVATVLDVIAVARSADGEDAMFFAYIEEQSGARANHIDYQGPEGTLSTLDGNATFTFENGTFSGAGTLVDDAATTSSMAQFNFTVPDELVDC